jgi:ATP-dependent Clp protease ATP-binding subunit ClpA
VALEPLTALRPQRASREPAGRLDITAALGEQILGQAEAIELIAPYVELALAGLAPEARPAGVFLLLGPTGTGKTRSVEALAKAIHGCEKNVLRVDCGEFQLDHEVAKLIGAPPGYLGHRETHPLLSQQKLNAVTSERSPLSIVLFDEIEKAAPSFARILLGVLDRATLKLGDNSTVNFENSLIFLTSNLGSRGMLDEMSGGFGFGRGGKVGARERGAKLSRIAMNEVRKRFSPEFVNRIDEIVTYRPLDREAMEGILNLQLNLLQAHVRTRTGCTNFEFELSARARRFLLNEGTSAECGARELKRALHRHLMQPLARLIVEQDVTRSGGLQVEFDARRSALEFTALRRAA